VVFNSPFMEEDRHSILDCNGINIFESIFDGGHRDFEVGLERFHRWDVGSRSGTSSNDHKWFDFPSSGGNASN
jgi:hypothetical protein